MKDRKRFPTRREMLKDSAYAFAGTVLAACTPESTQSVERYDSPAPIIIKAEQRLKDVDLTGKIKELNEEERQKLREDWILANNDLPAIAENATTEEANQSVRTWLDGLEAKMARSNMPIFNRTVVDLKMTEMILDSFARPVNPTTLNQLPANARPVATDYGAYKYDETTGKHYIFINSDPFRPGQENKLMSSTQVAFTLEHERQHALWTGVLIDEYMKLKQNGKTTVDVGTYIGAVKSTITIGEGYAYWKEAAATQFFIDALGITENYVAQPGVISSLGAQNLDLAAQRRIIIATPNTNLGPGVQPWHDPRWTGWIEVLNYRK